MIRELTEKPTGKIKTFAKKGGNRRMGDCRYVYSDKFSIQ